MGQRPFLGALKSPTPSIYTPPTPPFSFLELHVHCTTSIPIPWVLYSMGTSKAYVSAHLCIPLHFYVAFGRSFFHAFYTTSTNVCMYMERHSVHTKLLINSNLIAQVLIAYEVLHGPAYLTFSPRRDGCLSDGLSSRTVWTYAHGTIALLAPCSIIPPRRYGRSSPVGLHTWSSLRLICSNDMKVLLLQMRSK